jgi:large repetitive protein
MVAAERAPASKCGDERRRPFPRRTNSATETSGTGWRQWTVTAQVQSMYAGANHGFLVRDATEGGGGLEQGFHSREKGTDQPPQLVITFG